MPKTGAVCHYIFTKSDIERTLQAISAYLHIFGKPYKLRFYEQEARFFMAITNSDFLIETTINELQAGMQEGTLTSHDIVLAYFDRIATYDKDGPMINSILELNPHALLIAEAMDNERKTNGPRGPLHGIPVLLKDNIETGDRMHTSGGSVALANSYAADDAFIVRKLRKAGAVILGKANMTEMAKFVSSRMPNAYSSRGGMVLNPYSPGGLDVGGSSCGSGAAIAANLSVIAIGTETFGSIINPSVENSIVGINPTVGLVSRTGLIPLAPTHDTPGPMARTVTDAAIMLGVIAGMDEWDPSTRKGIGQFVEDYTVFLDPDGLRGARLGVPTRLHFPNLPAEKQRHIQEEIRIMQQLGAEIIELESMDALEEQAWDMTVLEYEFKVSINHYLAKLSPYVPVHSLKELIEYNKSYNEGVALYGQDLLLAAERTSGTLTEPEYIHAKSRDLLLSRTRGIDALVKQHRLDALVSPGHTGVAAPAKAGYPSVTVPGGYTKNGDPVGVTFTGMAFSEPTLIKIAYAYEQATKHRIPPRL
jgi:amidase